jgi:hypothetical protein
MTDDPKTVLNKVSLFAPNRLADGLSQAEFATIPTPANKLAEGTSQLALYAANKLAEGTSQLALWSDRNRLDPGLDAFKR